MTTELTQRAERCLAEWETASGFLQSSYMERLVERSVRVAVIESQSPFVDRSGAAARWRCSESEIDRAASAGILKRHYRNESPLFLKEQGDAAIQAGTWKIKH